MKEKKTVGKSDSWLVVLLTLGQVRSCGVLTLWYQFRYYEQKTNHYFLQTFIVSGFVPTDLTI